MYPKSSSSLEVGQKQRQDALSNSDAAMPEPQPLKLIDLSALKALYAAPPAQAGSARVESTVPPHRFGFLQVSRALNAGAADADAIEGNIDLWHHAELDWTSAVSLVMQTKLDVSYEQLEYLGLESGNGLNWLVATVRIKRALGYCGGVESQGSLEYVAFWADWDGRGTYSHLGTSEVRVYDTPSLPVSGSVYTVEMPLDRPLRRSVRVRAVLSWAVPPSTRDPYALTTWGNCIEAQIPAQVLAQSVPQGGTQPAFASKLDTPIDGLPKIPMLPKGHVFAPSSARGLHRAAIQSSSCR